jgi:hypothetical protein
MSDMIDRLGEVANEAGAESADRLAAGIVTAQLADRARKGARRRRITAASVTGAVVAMGVAAALVLPHVWAEEPIAPATDGRVPIETDEGLITYDDGSMQVIDQHGRAIDIPAAAAGAPTFSSLGIPDACAVDPHSLSPGWTTQFTDAFRVLTFGRPLVVDSSGYHVLAQGQRVVLEDQFRETAFAFGVDVDPAIAPYVVMKVVSLVLAPDGRVAFVGSHLESRPSIEYSGDKAAGTYTATLTTRGLKAFDECKGVSTEINPATASGLVHYLLVTVFVNDGHGHVNPIATHTSWVTLVREGQ